MNEELKPCPFCGSSIVKMVEERKCYGHGLFSRAAHVECPICGASTREFDDFNGDEGYREHAIEAWNTRAELTFQDEVQEAQHHLCELERITVEAWKPERTCKFVQNDAFSIGAVMCSSCGEYWFPENDKSRFNYCPSCGSKVIRNAD